MTKSHKNTLSLVHTFGREGFCGAPTVPPRKNDWLMGFVGLKMIENKKYWKVSWNKKLYDYERAVKEFKEGKRKFILQSRGRAHMVQCPTVGHIAYVCCDKRLVMKCVVKTDFITDNKQHNDGCNLGNKRTHSENDTYLKMEIIKVYDDIIPFEKGMRTWLPIQVTVA